MMLLSSYLNSDIGNSMVITNLLVGFAYLVISIYLKTSNTLRLEYRTPFATLFVSAGFQHLLHIFAVPPLIQTSLDTLVTMIAVAVAIVLIRDKSIR